MFSCSSLPPSVLTCSMVTQPVVLMPSECLQSTTRAWCQWGCPQPCPQWGARGRWCSEEDLKALQDMSPTWTPRWSAPCWTPSRATRTLPSNSLLQMAEEL
ncbi:hypothetical protein KUCAC02_001593 [Chaenocephalus aceratus]|uniref:Uncharacterized protein n=1 Tax=Chaenocephalus aceratus TaxID=36190 RepID=A0ACB9XSF5_CHAAC|nr:hypothetical protein KUCAC02_001593 [Chaenocephalus aceratus]